jgi:integrase
MPPRKDGKAKERRRANGEGTIYWHKALQRYTTQVIDRTGKRRTLYGKTEAEVVAKKAKLLDDVKNDRPTTPARLTLDRLFDEFLAAEKISTEKVSSFARLESCVRCHLRPALGTRKLLGFRTKDVNDFTAAKQQEKKKDGKTPCNAASSIRLMLHVLGKAFGLAEAYGYSQKGTNPVRGAQLPPLPKRPPRALTQAQAKQLLHGARGDRHEALYVLALTSALRISELCGLRWTDLDLDGAQVTIRKKLLYVQRQLIDDEAPKRDEIPPTLPLHPLAVAALQEHKKRQAEQQQAYPGDWVRPDLVFVAKGGKPLRAGNVTGQDMPRLLKKAGLTGFTPHSLRASAATIAAERGADISVAQHLLRHKDPATTMKYYRAVRPHEVKQAVSLIGDALAPDDERTESAVAG